MENIITGFMIAGVVGGVWISLVVFCVWAGVILALILPSIHNIWKDWNFGR